LFADRVEKLKSAMHSNFLLKKFTDELLITEGAVLQAA
jgi:hypothetical protein